MVAALREVEGQDEPLQQISPLQHPNTKSLHNFVTKNTNNFFTILGISQEFLQADPSEWECDTEYKRSQRLVQSLRVVNDLAERGVALIQEFNSTLTRDEEQKQYLLQVIEDHRKRFAAPLQLSLQQLVPICSQCPKVNNVTLYMCTVNGQLTRHTIEK